MKFISALCHPLLMATYMSFVLLVKAPELFSIPREAAWSFLVLIFLTTCLLPALSLFALKLSSRISSLELTNHKERLLPFLLIFISYGVTSFLFISKVQLSKPFSSIILSVTLLIGLLFIITKWFKISIHSTAIWGSVGILFSLVFSKGIVLPNLLLASVLLAGLTSTSRLYLGYHKPKEIWYGTILGFFFCFFSVYFFG